MSPPGNPTLPLSAVKALFTELPAGTYYTASEAKEMARWPKLQGYLFQKLVDAGFLELDPDVQPGDAPRYRKR